MRSRVGLVVGSHGDAGVIGRALEGADALFWIAPAETSLTLEGAYPDFTRPAATANASAHHLPGMVRSDAEARGDRAPPLTILSGGGA